MIEWLVQGATERMNRPGSRLFRDVFGVYIMSAIPMLLTWTVLDVFVARPFGRWMCSRMGWRAASELRAVEIVRVVHVLPFVLMWLLLAVKIGVALQREQNIVDRFLSQASLICGVVALVYIVYSVGFRASARSIETSRS